MKRLKLRTAVKCWPRAISPLSRTLAAGTVVNLVRKETATLFTVTVSDITETFPVLASEVEELEPQPA